MSFPLSALSINHLSLDDSFTSSCDRVHCRIAPVPGMVVLRMSQLMEEAPMRKTQPLRFREAKRIQQSFLATAEKKTLLWLAERTPAWINSDHLTILGLLAMAGAGAGYAGSRTNRAGLGLVVACLALQWLGSSQ